MARQIMTDAFVRDAQSTFPHLKDMNNDEVIQYFTNKYPNKFSNVEWTSPAAQPTQWEKFRSGWAESIAKKDVVAHNLLGTAKELVRTSESDRDIALRYQAERKSILEQSEALVGDLDYKGRKRKSRVAHEGREMREMLKLATPDEVNEMFTVSMQNADRGREIDAENHEKLLKEANEKIANDPKIQAVQAWYAENPIEGIADWWTPENIAYGLGQFTSSYVPIMVGGVAGAAVGGPVGGALAAGSMGYALEAGNHFDTAYDIAKNELKMDEASAYEAAANSSHIYGMVSAVLESIAPTYALKSMMFPKRFTRRFAEVMMRSSNKKISQMGKTLNKRQFKEAYKTAQAEAYARFGGAKKGFMENGKVRGFVWRAIKNRMPLRHIPGRGIKGFRPSEKWTEGFLEGITEASQFLAEQMILDGYLRKEDLPDGWLGEQMSKQEFSDSFALGTFAILTPGGGGGARRSTVHQNDDGTQTIVGSDGSKISGEGLDPTINGTYEPVSTEEGVETEQEEEFTPFMQRLKAYVDKDPTKRPVTKEKGGDVIDLGDALLDEVTDLGYEAIIELENHLLGDEERSELMQLLGGAIKKADDPNNPIFNIREDENGIINEEDVKWTLRGIIKHGLEVREQEVQSGMGLTEKRQTISFPKGSESFQDAARKQFENPEELRKNFGFMKITKLAAEAEMNRLEHEDKTPATGEGSQSQQEFEDTEDIKKDFIENKLPFHERVRERYINLHSDGKTEDAKKGILKLSAAKFRDFVENMGFSDMEDLELNANGTIKATAKNKNLIWDRFDSEMQSELELISDAEFMSGNETKVEEANRETPPQENTDEPYVTKEDNDESEEVSGPSQQEFSFDDDGKGYDFSQVEIAKDEEEQPKAYVETEEGYIATPETVEITSRLQKHFPEIQSEPLQQIFDEDGVEVAGKAFSDIAQWSQDKARIDDMPHEYFHIYLNAFENSPIIKAGLKKFAEGAANIQEAKEQFTELVGNYYANRITNKGLRNRVKAWIRQAWLHFKKKFSKLSKEEYASIVGEQFFKGVRPSAPRMDTSFKGVYYSNISEEEATAEDQVDDDGKPQEIVGLDNLKTDAGHMINNVFFAAFGAYIPKSYLAKDLPRMAKDIDNYDDFRQTMLDDILNKFNGIIGNEAFFEETMRTLYLTQKSRTLVSKIKKNDKLKGEDKRQVIDVDPAAGRIRYEMIFVKKPKGPTVFAGFQPQFEYNHVRKGTKNPQSFIQNHMELQDELLGDGARFMYLPLKMVFKHIKYDGGEFWVNDTRDIKLNEKWVNNIDKEFARRFKEGASMLPFFFTTKAGDNQQMILGVVPTKWQGSQQRKHHGKEINVTKITRDFFNRELQGQVEAGFITKAQKTEMLKDADALSKENIGKDPKTKKARKMGTLAHAIVLSNHIRWQQVKGSDYLFRNNNINDVVNRIRIDFAEGVVPYGAGDRTFLWMNNEDIEIRSPNKDGVMDEWDRKRPFGGEHDGEDGALYTGGQYLNKIGSQFGMETTADIKTSIRHIQNSDNLHTYPDYVGMKHMEMTPMPGMQIFKKGNSEPFIEVVGQGVNTRFKVLQGEQAGLEFDTFGTNNEIKDASGTFAKRGVVHTLPETATRVLIKSKSATSAAHPVNVHELLLSDDITDIPEGVEYLKALNESIEEHVNSRMNILFAFRENPKLLRDFLYKELRTGEVPTELQQYLELTPNGEALTIPSVLNQVVSLLNNKFINGGMMRMRTSEGRGTKLHLKPSGNLTISPRSAIVSAGNSTMVNLIEQEYAESLGRERDYKFQWFNNHDKIKTLNEFLGINPFMVNIHRQPIQGAAKFEPRRIQQFLEGNHGNTIFLTAEDVFVLHDGDFDGDTVFLERPENLDLLNAMDALSQTEWFNKRKKVVGLQIYEQKDASRSLSSRKDRGNFYQGNANAMFSQGMTVNAKTVSAVMAYKNLTFADNFLPKGVKYEVRKPGDIIVMDYINLNAQELLNNQESWDLITKVNGDEVVVKNPDYKKGESDEWFVVEAKNLPALIKAGETLHLRTTFENEMSNILQMSVDNAKFGLLGDIHFGKPFLMRRIFRRTDGGYISDKVSLPLSMVYNTFKYSATRRGRDKFQNKLNMSEIMIEFEDIRNRYYSQDGSVKQSEDINETIEVEVMSSFKKPFKMKKTGQGKVTWEILDLNIDPNRITPMEKLLAQPDLYKDRLDPDIKREMSGTPLHYQEGTYRYAHVMSLRDMEKSSALKFKEILGNVEKATKAHKALQLAKDMAAEFYGILGNIGEKQGKTAEEIEGIKYDLSEDFVDFIEKWIPEFNKLDSMQQSMATLKFLSGSEQINLKGTKTKKAFVLKLLPIELMHKSTLRTYVKQFKKHLGNNEKIAKEATSEARYNFPWKKFQEIVKENKCF